MKRTIVHLTEEDYRNESFPKLPPDGVFELDVHLETSEVYDTIREFIKDQLLERNIRIDNIEAAFSENDKDTNRKPDRMIIRCISCFPIASVTSMQLNESRSNFRVSNGQLLRLAYNDMLLTYTCSGTYGESAAETTRPPSGPP